MYGDFDIHVDLTQFRRDMSAIEREQMPFATRLALNETAKEVVEDFRSEMVRAFDRPTPWTLNAFHVKWATKTNQVATVQRKTPQRGRHYLEVQSAGGVRPQTALEKLVASRLKYGGIVRTIAPAGGARLNTYGNWSPAQRNQVLSAIKAQRDARSNTTKRSQKRAKSRSQFFVPKPGSKLSSGVFERRGKRGKLKKIVHISGSSSSYRQRVQFEKVAVRRVSMSFEKNFATAFARAMATAR